MCKLYGAALLSSQCKCTKSGRNATWHYPPASFGPNPPAPAVPCSPATKEVLATKNRISNKMWPWSVCSLFCHSHPNSRRDSTVGWKFVVNSVNSINHESPATIVNSKSTHTAKYFRSSTLFCVFKYST